MGALRIHMFYLWSFKLCASWVVRAVFVLRSSEDFIWTLVNRIGPRAVIVRHAINTFLACVLLRFAKTALVYFCCCGVLPQVIFASALLHHSMRNSSITSRRGFGIL